MRCLICDKEYDTVLSRDWPDLCPECCDITSEAEREMEDWNGEFIKDLNDTSDVSKVWPS